MGGLNWHLDAWLSLPAEPWVVDVIRSGFGLPWAVGKAPLSPSPIVFPSPQSPEAFEALNGEVLSLIQKSGVKEVMSSHSGAAFTAVFVVPNLS